MIEMKNLFILALSFSCIMLFGQANSGIVDPNEILKPFPKGFKDTLGLDYNMYESLGPKKMKELEINAVEEYKHLILQEEDCPQACLHRDALASYLYSKGTGKCISYSIGYDSDKPYLVSINYWIFSNDEGARHGTRYETNAHTGIIHPYQVNQTYTGKRIGEFCLRGMNHSAIKDYKSLNVLYKRVYFQLSISSKVEDSQSAPELIDLWAAAVLNKIKKGLGEKLEPVKKQ
jgi:hypothetical protein